MSDPDNFLARWSRRKREATDETRKDEAAAGTHEADAHAEIPDAGDPVAAKKAASVLTEAEPPFDPASLPAVDSITAETDIRAFFAPGVPAHLTREALRRAWSADPAIRDFVGLAENAWDFNDPNAMPGFGPLEMTPELRREVARIVGQLLPDEEETAEDSAAAPQPAPEAAPLPQAPEPVALPPQSVASYQSNEFADEAPVKSGRHSVESDPPVAIAQRNKEDAAAQQRSGSEPNLQSSAKRGHGGALPQ